MARPWISAISKGLDALLPSAQPAGFDGWPMVNAYSYAYVLAYSDAAFPNGAPDSWQVMLDPKYKGRIALYDDGIGFHPAAQVAGGGKIEDIPGNMQPAWDFIAKIKEQAPLLGEDPDFTNWFQQGQIDLACTILSNAREAKMNGVKVSWTVPKEGCDLETDALWVPKNPAGERSLLGEEVRRVRHHARRPRKSGAPSSACRRSIPA